MDFSFEDDPTSDVPVDSEYYSGEYYEDQDYESSDNSYDHTADSFNAPPPPPPHQNPFPVEDVCPAPPPPSASGPATPPPGSPFSLNLKALSAVNNPGSSSFKKPMQLPPTPHDKIPSREELSRPDSLPLPASPLPPPPPARDRRVAPPRANIVGVSSPLSSNGSPLVPERQTSSSPPVPSQTSSDSALAIPRRPAAPPRQSSSLSSSSLVATNPQINPSVPLIPSSALPFPSTIPPPATTPLPNASSPQKPPPIPSSAPPPLPSAPPPLPTSAPPLPSGIPPKPSVLGTPPKPSPPIPGGRGGAPPPAPSRQNTFSGPAPPPSGPRALVIEQNNVLVETSASLSDVTLSINHIKDWPHVVRSCLLELEHLDFDRCHQAHASHPLFKSQCLIDNSLLINGSRRSLLPGYEEPPHYSDDASLYSFQKYAAGNLQSQAPSTHSSSSSGSGRRRTITGDPSMQHSKKISNSLHKLSTKQQQTIALEIFDNILCFMGDKVAQKPGSSASLALSAPLTAENVSKPSTEHLILAQNILDIGVQSLSSDTIICNEIYAQLIKQLSNNSKMESEERGWMLMCFATSSFTPDSELMPYLVHYLKKSTTDPTIANFAWFSLQALQKTLTLQKKGSYRSFAPSVFELQSLVNLAPMMCRVSCMDGTQKAFYIDGEATILQLLHSFCDKMEIPYSTRLNFGLFISIASSFSSSGSSSSSSSLHASSASKDFEKALAFNMLVVDAFRVLEKQLLQRSAAIENVKSSENMKFWFQRITYTNRKKPYNSAIEKQMMFFQIRRDILHNRLPLDPSTAVKLLTLIHQYDNGDYNENDVISEPQVHKYIPPLLLQTLVSSFPSSAALISKISEEHLALLHTSREQVIDRFVRLAQQLTFYGCYLYPVELDNAPDCASDLGINIKNHQPDSPPFELQIVVSEVGIQFFSSDLSELYQLFPFSRLARWGSSSLHCQIEYFANDGVTKKLALLKSSEASHIAKIITAFTMRIAELSCFAKVIEEFVPEQFQSSQEEGLTYSDLLLIKPGDHLLILEKDKGNGWEFGVKLTDRLDSQVDFFSNFGNFPASYLTHIIELPPNYRRALSAVVSSSM